jgi:hypothetical protein
MAVLQDVGEIHPEPERHIQDRHCHVGGEIDLPDGGTGTQGPFRAKCSDRVNEGGIRRPPAVARN